MGLGVESVQRAQLVVIVGPPRSTNVGLLAFAKSAVTSIAPTEPCPQREDCRMVRHVPAAMENDFLVLRRQLCIDLLPG